MQNSVPLVSTQNIIHLMGNLVQKHKFAIFLIAAMIESDSYQEQDADAAIKELMSIYQIGYEAIAPLFEHEKIDCELGHKVLLKKNKKYFEIKEHNDVHSIINAMHDIKHAFDLQKLEIIDYYTKLGNYVPRKKVDYFGT